MTIYPEHHSPEVIEIKKENLILSKAEHDCDFYSVPIKPNNKYMDERYDKVWLCLDWNGENPFVIGVSEKGKFRNIIKCSLDKKDLQIIEKTSGGAVECGE